MRNAILAPRWEATGKDLSHTKGYYKGFFDNVQPKTIFDRKEFCFYTDDVDRGICIVKSFVNLFETDGQTGKMQV